MHKTAICCCACAAFGSPAATAQPATAHPADPRVAVTQTQHPSAFAGYRPFRDQPLAPWRAANDEVGRIDGQAGTFGGAGHAGHGGANTIEIENAPAPAVAPTTPRPMPGPGHQGMTK